MWWFNHRTDITNITADNYVYTFINKSTSDSITLRVKEEIFPERFFELRTKNKLETATQEERKAFKLLWEELKEKAMYKPISVVFKEAQQEITRELVADWNLISLPLTADDMSASSVLRSIDGKYDAQIRCCDAQMLSVMTTRFRTA